MLIIRKNSKLIGLNEKGSEVQKALYNGAQRPYETREARGFDLYAWEFIATLKDYNCSKFGPINREELFVFFRKGNKK